MSALSAAFSVGARFSQFRDCMRGQRPLQLDSSCAEKFIRVITDLAITNAMQRAVRLAYRAINRLDHFQERYILRWNQQSEPSMAAAMCPKVSFPRQQTQDLQDRIVRQVVRAGDYTGHNGPFSITPGDIRQRMYGITRRFTQS